jgi:hypothetical protein
MLPSVSGDSSKRQRIEPEENEEMKCLICLDLAVDAVQVGCCGALHCRACVLRCTVCPQCRATIPSIIPDVRRERLSAAALRHCPQQEFGCMFLGNRASVASHQETCDFIPRDRLRMRILNAESQNVAYRQRIKELLICSLNPEPADSALRLFHGICSSKGVFEINRAETSGCSHWVCSWIKSEQRPRQYPHRMEQCVDVIRRTLMVTASDASFPFLLPSDFFLCASFVTK